MWHAWCPTLLDYGAATWGLTREEALGHIREVVAMVVERMVEEGGEEEGETGPPRPRARVSWPVCAGL
jgi:predicted RNase H-like HicB family nuclease